MTSAKEVVQKQSQEVAIPVEIADMLAQHTGAGFEATDSEDFSLPFIQVIQKMSPVMDENPDAKPGMFYNTVSEEIYDQLEVIPCAYKKEFMEWVPHDQGGGIVGSHDYDSGIDKQAEWSDKGQFLLPNGNQLVDTRYHYVLGINPHTGETFPAVLAMSGTQVKVSKRWMSVMNARKINVKGVKRMAPMFAFSYVLTTKDDSNDKGKWKSIVVTPGAQNTAMGMMEEAIELYKGAATGEAKRGDLAAAEEKVIHGETINEAGM